MRKRSIRLLKTDGHRLVAVTQMVELSLPLSGISSYSLDIANNLQRRKLPACRGYAGYAG